MVGALSRRNVLISGHPAAAILRLPAHLYKPTRAGARPAILWAYRWNN